MFTIRPRILSALLGPYLNLFKMRLLLLVVLLSGFFTAGAQRYVFVFLNNKPDKETLSEERSAKLMEQHLANIEKLAEEDKLLVAGPFDGGGGIFILNTGDLEVAKAWLQSDPAIKAQRWNLEIFKVNFDKGGACLVGEPYEMVTYNFARLNFVNDIANYKMNRTVVDGWQQAVKAEAVIAVGRFPQYDGGFIVYRGDNNIIQENFSDDQVGLGFKKLWVARGAFCE